MFCVVLATSLRRSPGDVYAVALACLAVLSLETILVTLAMRAGIGVDAGGVTVRSLLGRSRRVPWQDVVRFHAEEIGSYRGTTSYRVAVVCRDGPPLSANGCLFNTRVPTDYAELDRVVGALEAVHRQAQRGARTDEE